MSACSLCTRAHSMQKVCSFQDLASRVSKLIQANSVIPNLMAANKEAAVLATHYRQLLKRADEAHMILFDVLAKHENGSKIGTEYLEALDQWGKQFTSQDTEESQLSTEPSTLPETETKLSIAPTPGKVSPLDI